MTREIPLQNRKGETVALALVDDDLFDHLVNWRWLLFSRRYAARMETINGRSHVVLMHRYIMGDPQGHEVDHKNTNKLDNQKHNLRICTHAQNIAHTPKRNMKSSSRFKGVSWNKVARKWNAKICADRKRISLGYFVSELEAAHAYNEAAIKYHGEFARLNDL